MSMTWRAPFAPGFFLALPLLLLCLCVSGVPADCSARFPWIEPALKKFAKRAFESARQSFQTNEDGLNALKAIKWGQHPPGMEEVTLRYNESWGGVDMLVQRVSNPNQPYKPVGMLNVLRRAVQTHQQELTTILKGKGDMKFIIETEDFPIAWAALGWRLPAFAMCADPHHIDIPVPDFTFEDYPETRYTNTSWWAIRELVLAKGKMVPWGQRRKNIFMRHFGGVGYRKTLLPVLLDHQTNGTDQHHLGIRADIKDTGFVGSNERLFVWLDQWCAYRYLLHTAGFSYSAGLKYKLACGSVVFVFESEYVEFYYPALQAGVHYIPLQESDHAELHSKVFPDIKKQVAHMEGRHHIHPPDMANEARKFVQEHLTPDALSCYWLKALILYSKIWFTKNRDEVPWADQITFDI